MTQQLVTDKKSRPISVTISIVLTVLTLGYFLPWMIAAMRGKSNTIAVFLLNLLIGWTVIGWIVALVMASTSHQVAGIAPQYPQQQYLPPQPHPGYLPPTPSQPYAGAPAPQVEQPPAPQA